MPTLREKDTKNPIGRISDADLQFLIDKLEEESSGDTDYWIDENTITFLQEEGASAELVSLLRSAIKGRDGVDLEWTRD